MGMFDSFLGQDTGYTKAQSTGLRRSAEIKKRRKEDERAFERQKMKFEAGEAAKERGHKELMTAMAGLEERKGQAMKPQPESQYKLQQLRGKQQREAATTAATRGADVKSMEYARGLTRGDIEHKRAKEIAGIKKKGALESLFSDSGETATPGMVARRGLEGNQKEYTFSQFTGLNREEQVRYMTHMKGKDPKKYLDFARQYKLLAAPKEEVGGADLGGTGQSIYQSDSGTYRNF